jgi:hypothetical protein
MKGWLCLIPVVLTVGGYHASLPPDTLALLAVYRTKKDAQKEHGENAVLVRVFIPKAQPKSGTGRGDSGDGEGGKK